MYKVHKPFCLTAAFFLLGYGLCSSQQNSKEKQVSIGLNFAPNLTSTPGQSYIKYAPAFNTYKTAGYKVGYNIGGFISYSINKHFLLQSDMGFGRYNQKQVYSNSNPPDILLSTSYTDAISESEIDLAVLIKYKTKFCSFMIGPQISQILAARILSVSRSHGYNGTSVQEEEIDFKANDQTRNPVLAITGGLNKDNAFKKWGIGIYYRYQLSDYTDDYKIRRIGHVDGFVMKLSHTFPR